MIALKSAQKLSSNYEMIIGIDRSDKTLSVAKYCQDGQIEEQEVNTRAWSLERWWSEVRQQCPDGVIAVAFEQPARNLIAFFEDKPNTVIYALNPASIWAYRQSLRVSRAHTDQSDALNIGAFVQGHLDKLEPYQSASSLACKLRTYCKSRRKFVDLRTQLTNRLQEILKSYYPEVLDLLQEDIYRVINLDFLSKWSNPQSLKRAQKRTLESFYYEHGSRSERRIQERLEVIEQMGVLSEDDAIIEPAEFEVLGIVEQIRVLNQTIVSYDKRIRTLMSEQGGQKAQMIEKLPGAGPVLAPRLFAAFEAHVPNCKDAAALSALVGMAPVTEQSGQIRRVYRRLRTDHFLMQSFHEWTKESWKHSVWAKAYVRHQQAHGMPFNTIMRSLAVKWIRIIYRLWKTGEFYDEQRYIQTLVRKNHYLKYALQ
jgi:transposase